MGWDPTINEEKLNSLDVAVILTHNQAFVYISGSKVVFTQFNYLSTVHESIMRQNVILSL